MLIQIPLIVLTDAIQKIKGIRGKVAGNMIFWISFCIVGQPLAALLYFFAWQAKYGSVAKQYQLQMQEKSLGLGLGVFRRR
jgi:diacylglycerol O-acyltransferase-1